MDGTEKWMAGACKDILRSIADHSLLNAGSHLLTQCAALSAGVTLESPQVKKEQWLKSQEAGGPGAALLCDLFQLT